MFWRLSFVTRRFPAHGDSACMTITYLPATLPAVTLR